MLVMENQLLTLEEAAERLKISKFTVRRFIEIGKLEGVRVGRQWRVTEEEIKRYIAANTQKREQ